ncbi:LacI family DNA-binding transcriptional regulator [Corticibacterium sp. UT-5YL-CI-8]|nr:LacI family DNA-binding transcriptional regulator [Tianweitania sp. UT-5YL-CI-8]
MTTLHDVARDAGVSTATVSRVLRGVAITAPATREKVLSAVKKLGYSPNPIGQALRAGHVNSVALLMGDIEQGWYSSLARDMQLALEAEGLDLLLFNLGHSETRLRVVLERAVSMRLRGVALATSDRFPADKLTSVRARLAESNIPLVAVGSSLDQFGIPSIAHDDSEASCAAVHHLVERGHHPIAFLSRIEKSATGRVRFEGYRRGLQECGLGFDPELVWDVSASYRFKAGHDALLDAVGRKLGMRAVIAGSDEIALGAMAGALDLGLRVPEDIAFIGFGGLEWGGYVRPALTTLDADTSEFGRQFSALLKASHGAGETPRKLIARRLIARQTS